MAKKNNIVYTCPNEDCDAEPTTKFTYLCRKCKTPVEEKEVENLVIKGKTSKKSLTSYPSKSKKISEIDSENANRIDTGIKQINIVFGKNSKNNSSGLAQGSVNLLSGHPGVGKSTLLLSIINNIANKFVKEGKNCIYISGEESESQIKDRHERLCLTADYNIISETNYEKIKSDIEDNDFIIIDSINTIYIDGVGTIGGISQINEVTTNLIEVVKKSNKTLLMIAQINKSGDMAGPQRLAHMVDGVFFFDDFDDSGIFKIITCEKNRFGKVNETAIFEMTEKGMVEIADPSMIFIDENGSIGTALSLIFKGNRPIIIEIESLVAKTESEKTITTAVGLDQKKIFQIVAICSKFLKISMYQKNIFSNVVGGLNLTKGKPQTQIDLAILASILSSDKEVNINQYIFIGEVSLSGSIRKVPQENVLIEHIEMLFKNKTIISNTTGYKHVTDLVKLF
jgi:DNA repair protein RadA/Sms